MEKTKIMRAEDMDSRQLAELVLDMLHRLNVHHTLWFREVEHQIGFSGALEVMDRAWEKIRPNLLERMGGVLGFSVEDGVPSVLAAKSQAQLLEIADAVAKCWLAQDGLWFQAVEFSRGMNDAKRCNDSTWTRFSPFEAWSIKKLLGLGEEPGLEGLERALNFRMYGRINRQSCRREDGALYFYMDECRVQSARKRREFPDYPCKSAGLVEYSTFAAAIDSRIRTECIGCPPDKHPAEWYCCWKFTLEK